MVDYNRAIELDPDWAQPYYNRGFAYRKNNEFKQAIADLERYLELAPDASDAAQIRQKIEEMKEQLGK